ncbi:Uncharacterised protein [uncultured archaeon]|nr:Uncharacterised protein [uncultured archaeon]
MPNNKKPMLEKILDTVGKNFSEEKVHAAMLLSFAESMYSIVRRDCTPSPFYRVSFDKTNHCIEMEETKGHSKVPKKNVLDINDMDLLLMCDLREIPGLLEGETGVGKTFGIQRYLSTVFKEGQYFSHRLSANAFLNNLFQHFQEGKMVNGMPVVEARKDRIERTAAGVIDEINRGDPNETLQLFDNEMHLGGLIYKLGIPIPEIKSGAYNENTGRKKKMFLVSAQNPSSSDDAKFTGTMQLDAAVDNRLLKIYMNNAAASAGSTLWLGDGKGKRHELFLNDFSKRTAKKLGLDEKLIAEDDDTWLSTYAWITDSSKTDKPILYSAIELADLMTSVFSGNLINYYKYEKQVLTDWNSELGTGIEINEDLQETEKVKKIHEVTDSFKVPIIFRDIVQIKKVADILATLKNIKDSLRTKDPVKNYVDIVKCVTVREVAEATALVARNKQRANSVSPVYGINEVLNQYCKLTEEYMKEAKRLHPQFDIYDGDAGIKNIAIYRAIRENISGSRDIDGLIKEIVKESKKLVGKISISEDVRNVMIARSASDLMTLCGFLDQYKQELQVYKETETEKPVLQKYKKPTDANKILEAIGKFYCEKQRDDAITMPDIYQHRIQRTLGIENSL